MGRCRRGAVLAPGRQAAADTLLSLDDLEGQDCFLGLALASRTDLAAMALVFPTNDLETGRATYTAFVRCCLDEAPVAEARNPSYPGRAASGHLVVTPGNQTDFAAPIPPTPWCPGSPASPCARSRRRRRRAAPAGSGRARLRTPCRGGHTWYRRHPLGEAATGVAECPAGR